MPQVEAPILKTLLQLVDQIWQVEQLCVDPAGKPQPYPLYRLLGPLADQPDQAKGQEWLSQTLIALQDAVNGNLVELSRQAALLYFRPFAWLEPYTYDYTRPENERFVAAARGEIMQTVLNEWLQLHQTRVSRALLTERLETLLQGPGAKWKPDLYRPTMTEILGLLLEDPTQEAIAITSQLVAGEYGRVRKGSVEEPELRNRAPRLFLKLWEAHLFDYDIFRQAVFSLPGAFHDLSRPLEKHPAFFRNLPPSFSIELQSFALRLATDLAEKLPSGDQEAAALLKQVAYLEGASWLLLACAYVEEKGLIQLPNIRKAHPDAAATRLCQTHRPHTLLEDDAQTVEFLRHYHPATLRAVLPHAKVYRDLIEKALE